MKSVPKRGIVNNEMFASETPAGARWVDNDDATAAGAKPRGGIGENGERFQFDARSTYLILAKHRRRAAPQGQRAIVGIAGGEVDKIAAFVARSDDDARDMPTRGVHFVGEVKTPVRTKSYVRDFKIIERPAPGDAIAMNAESEEARANRFIQDHRPTMLVERAFAFIQADAEQAKIVERFRIIACYILNEFRQCGICQIIERAGKPL